MLRQIIITYLNKTSHTAYLQGVSSSVHSQYKELQAIQKQLQQMKKMNKQVLPVQMVIHHLHVGLAKQLLMLGK